MYEHINVFFLFPLVNVLQTIPYRIIALFSARNDLCDLPESVILHNRLPDPPSLICPRNKKHLVNQIRILKYF